MGIEQRSISGRTNFSLSPFMMASTATPEDRAGGGGGEPGPPPSNSLCRAVTDLLSYVPTEHEFLKHYDEVKKKRDWISTVFRFRLLALADSLLRLSSTLFFSPHLSRSLNTRTYTRTKKKKTPSSPPPPPPRSPSAPASTASRSSSPRPSPPEPPCSSNACRSSPRRLPRAPREPWSAPAASGS